MSNKNTNTTKNKNKSKDADSNPVGYWSFSDQARRAMEDIDAENNGSLEDFIITRPSSTTYRIVVTLSWSTNKLKKNIIRWNIPPKTPRNRARSFRDCFVKAVLAKSFRSEEDLRVFYMESLNTIMELNAKDVPRESAALL